jgi:dienelactone hydrolase
MRRLRKLACFSWGLALLGVFALADSCPVFELPVPTGSFAIGSTVLPPEAFTLGTKASRLQVQLWYPAEKSVRGTTAPYISVSMLKLMREQKYYGQPECVYDAWSRMSTHAFLDVPASPERLFPLILFLPGEGVSRSSYASFAEQFASDGNVVAAIDFVHDGFMFPLDDTPDAGSEADAAVAVKEWSQDASRFLDKLLASEAAYNLPRDIWSHIDHKQIAAVGHSLGGAAALQICQTDSRVRACVDMDGAAFGEVAEKGLGTGALVLLSHVDHTDAELKARGRTREQLEAMGKQRTAEWQRVLAPAGGAVWVMRVQGTGHFTFSDGPFTMPNTITSFGGILIDSKRGLAVISGTVEAYLKSVFAPSVAFDPAQYSEATVSLSRPPQKSDLHPTPSIGVRRH